MFQTVSDFISSKSSTSNSIAVGAQLTTILHNYQNIIHVPRLVVVGTQSSGKTSVLNGIIGIPILPTGTQITTRTPIHIELCPIEDPAETCVFVNDVRIDLTYQLYSDEEIHSIASLIEMTTNTYTQNTKNISSKPIYIKVMYIGIPHLYLIDLPGLTLVARTDEGQPKDIKTQIRKLVTSYIDTDHTYILAIMAARSDIETDMALELIKEYDTKLERTLGVLTKVDLMGTDSSIEKYIEHSNLCIDLQMGFKYIAVRNFSDDRTNKKETDFFSNNPKYSALYNSMSDRFGIKSVREKSVCLLEDALKKELPKIKTKIKNHIQELETQLSSFSTGIDPDNYKTYLHSIITSMCYSCKDQLDGRRVNRFSGRKLKQTFISFRDKINEIDPLESLNDFDINEIMENVEGNHMTLSIPSIDTIEYIMTSEKNNPIDLLEKPMFDTIDEIIGEIKNVYSYFIETNKQIEPFVFCQEVLKTSMDEYIGKLRQNARIEIKKLIQIQKSYIWSDDPEFILNTITVTKSSPQIGKDAIVARIRRIINAYFKTVVFQYQDFVPKLLMHSIVLIFSDNSLKTDVFENIMEHNNLGEIFSIPSAVLLEKEKRELEMKALVQSLHIIDSFIFR